MINTIFKEISENYSFYLKLLLEHITISFISVCIAILIGLSIGIIISKKPKIAKNIISIVNILYTIPSIALLGFLISFTGIGNLTVIIALTTHALLPMVRSTYVGISEIDPKIIEAGKAMGSSEFQLLYKIKLPLAFLQIFSSIRNMPVMTIALAGIASFVGAGGLGVSIYRGITINNTDLILIGSILIALLAIFVDGFLGILKKLIIQHKLIKPKVKLILIILLSILFILSSFNMFYKKNSNDIIKIASKPTTEGYILAEIVKTIIENDTNIRVDITHGIGGGTSNIHPAILKGYFDIYQEYTGTAWKVILKKDNNYDENMFNDLKKEYEEKYNLTWKGFFGFNNTYSLAIRKDLSQKFNINTFSELVNYSKSLIFGAEFDFFEREDGLKGLKKLYNLNFKEELHIDNGLKYKSLLENKLDVMTVFTTDGQLSNPNIKVLKDDLKFYPKYLASNVIRLDTLKRFPILKDIFLKINNLILEKDMAKLNYNEEILKENPKEVAKNYLKEKGLLKY